MKVLGGTHRGRAIRSARGRAMRPTAAALRETLFNLIGGRVDGCRFLDLCAGSGSVGIEALSRGARHAFFVDSHRTAIALIKRNLGALGLQSRASILQRDALRALGELERRGQTFDLAFLDPPYDSDLVVRCLRSPRWRAIMPGRKDIFVEHRRDIDWPHLSEWEMIDSRRFGETGLTVFRGAGEA